jgi:hypothetical protein
MRSRSHSISFWITSAPFPSGKGRAYRRHSSWGGNRYEVESGFPERFHVRVTPEVVATPEAAGLTLACLALGSAGLARWRSRRRTA